MNAGIKTIEIVISPTGQSTVTTKGFTGSSCREASRIIEQALGKKTEETLTPEFYATTTQPVQQTAGR